MTNEQNSYGIQTTLIPCHSEELSDEAIPFLDCHASLATT